MMHAAGGILCLCALFFVAVQAQQSTEATGFFSEPVGLDIEFTEDDFNCSLASLFQPVWSDLPFNISERPYATSPISCHNRSLGVSATSDSCRWVPQTFLGIMYDRGIELLRHNVPQRDAFQVFEHARLVLLQYETCGYRNGNGTVDVPMAVEALYGFVFGKIQAKNMLFRLPRVIIVSNVSDAAVVEAPIANMRSEAVMVDVNLPFPLSSELTSNTLNSYEVNSDLRFPTTLNASNIVPNPVSDDDCNTGDYDGTWNWNHSISPDHPLQACCAQSCTGLLDTVGVAPSTVAINMCCNACNLHDCDAADALLSFSIAAVSTVQVPSLENGKLTKVHFRI